LCKTCPFIYLFMWSNKYLPCVFLCITTIHLKIILTFYSFKNWRILVDNLLVDNLKDKIATKYFVSLRHTTHIGTTFVQVNIDESRDSNGAGRARVSLSHIHPCKKNSSPSPYPNPTGIKLLTHPHPHRITGIILYPYLYPFSYYFNINFN